MNTPAQPPRTEAPAQPPQAFGPHCVAGDVEPCRLKSGCFLPWGEKCGDKCWIRISER